MQARKNFFDEFQDEILSEMAGNFFTRRKEMESRLETFHRLADDVRANAYKALARWRTLLALLVDEDLALSFCRDNGFPADHVPTLAASQGKLWRFPKPFGLTENARYRKSVRHAYQAARQTTIDYMEGSYGPAPGNPMKKVLCPNRASLLELAQAINAQVDSVNTGQSPSQVLTFAKSLDPLALEREKIVGAVLNDAGRLDREMAFKPIDFKNLALPELPIPPALEDIQERLDALSDKIFSTHRQAASHALDGLAN